MTLTRDPTVCGATFTKDTFTGGWPLFESLASVLCLADHAIVLDCGSTDGTLEALKEIAAANPRVRVISSDAFRNRPTDAGVFADVANECIAKADLPHVWFWQADEIPHHELLKTLSARWASDLPEREKYDLSFWRLQVSHNFQKVTWFPHIVHRVIWKGWKDDQGVVTAFVGDGRSTNREWGARLVHRDEENNGGRFPMWSQQFEACPEKMPFHEFLLDCTRNFLGNIRAGRKLHAPFWREPEDMVAGLREKMDVFMAREEGNPAWEALDSPFDIPHVLHQGVSDHDGGSLVGTSHYLLREGLRKALQEDVPESVVIPGA